MIFDLMLKFTLHKIYTEQINNHVVCIAILSVRTTMSLLLFEGPNTSLKFLAHEITKLSNQADGVCERCLPKIQIRRRLRPICGGFQSRKQNACAQPLNAAADARIYFLALLHRSRKFLAVSPPPATA